MAKFYEVKTDYGNTLCIKLKYADEKRISGMEKEDEKDNISCLLRSSELLEENECIKEIYDIPEHEALSNYKKVHRV